MKLDDAQKKQVAQWIEQGAKLSEIQTRIAAEFKLSMTYMDVRFLVDDLKLVPKDPVKAPEPVLPTPPPPPAPAAAAQPEPVHDLDEPALPPVGATNVSVSVDQIARPGALVSGKV